MSAKDIKDTIIRELPNVLREHPEVREIVLEIVRKHAPERSEFDRRFDQVLRELREDREESRRKWEEQNSRWDEQNRKWDEQNQKWEEQNRRWNEQNRRWNEQNRRWEEHRGKLEEQNSKWDEQNRKWDANQRNIEDLIKKLDASDKEWKTSLRRIETTFGAIGARWGGRSEKAFRDGLRGIMTDLLDVEVVSLTEIDETGEVLDVPGPAQIDLVVRNGRHIVCEIKSSASRADVAHFNRKVRLYEKRHKAKVDRKILISPMIDPGVKELAEKLEIEVYPFPDEIEL